MKIAFLTSEYPHHKTGSSGGIGTSIKNLANGLKSLGCDVLVLVYGQNMDDVFDDNGVQIVTIKNIKFKGFSWYFTRKKIQKKIDCLYRNKQIDLIEVADWTGISSFISPKKCPVVIKLHGSDTYFCDLEKRKSKWINRFHEKRALKKADFHVAVSKFVAQETNRIFNTNYDFKIIHNGIDPEVFNNISTNNTENPENTILYFGSLIRKKGMLELPLIFNELIQINQKAKMILIGKDVRDVVSGSDSTWAMMQSLFSKKALQNVSYRGAISYEKMQQEIQLATVCVFPSFAEALPLSWLEAMAMKKPIVASNIGWASEIITDGCDGLLENPKNHMDFAVKIFYLMTDLDLQTKVIINASENFFKNFDIHKIAMDNLNFYNDLISKKP